jgi:hypothetical protein
MTFIKIPGAFFQTFIEELMKEEGNEYKWMYKKDKYRCMVLRCIKFGLQWNGYVSVPKGHPLFGVTADDAERKCNRRIRVHGGLTYYGYYDEEEDKNKWWTFGFDTGHGDDFSPGMEFRLRKDNPSLFGGPFRDSEVDMFEIPVDGGLPRSYKTKEYAIAETNNLARQLEVCENTRWYNNPVK